MIDRHITHLIEKHTAENSHFETCRNYVSLSHCHLPVDEIVNQNKNGFADNLRIRLKCYKGYQMENDLVKRLIQIFGNKIRLNAEIQAFDGLVKGHPDFLFEGYPGDCKSVLMDEWLPDGRLPRRVYWQMQGYMKYSTAEKALVVYESRETGIPKAFWIYANRAVQTEIDNKLTEAVKRIKEAAKE